MKLKVFLMLDNCLRKTCLIKILFIFLCSLGIFLRSTILAKSQNAGLGPLEIRTQYPVTMPFLSMYPENTKTLGSGVAFFSYGYAVGNTIMNTEGKDRQITKDEVNRGIVISDFYDKETNKAIPGFRMYMDVESNRHLFRFKYGLGDSFEIGVEKEFITHEGGCCWDKIIEDWHSFVAVENDTEHGNYRSYIHRSGYDYYVVKDGEFVIATSSPFMQIEGDLYANLKWNLTEGGTFMPAIAAKFSYKFAKKNRSEVQKFISSGSSDHGSYLILSKGFGDYIVYVGEGVSVLKNSGVFASKLFHRFTTFEYRFGDLHSFIFQTMVQSSIFPQEGRIRRTSGQSISFDPSNSTDAAVVGYKGWWKDWFFEIGFVEDFNQVGNETDIVIYFEGGMKW